MTVNDPPRDVIAEYTKMAVALKSCGRDIFFGMCEHGTTAPWTWAAAVGNSWRIGEDIRDRWFDEPGECWGIMQAVDYRAVPAAPYARLGNYNDPDMLVCGLRGQTSWMGAGCTDIEYRSQFMLWCMLSAPLLIGTNVCNIDRVTLELLTHKGLIEINQDRLCHPAERVRHEDGKYDVWMRPLSGVRWAVCVLNRSDSPAELAFTYSDMKLSEKVKMTMTSVWTGDKLGTFDTKYSETFLPHEAKVYVLEPTF